MTTNIQIVFYSTYGHVYRWSPPEPIQHSLVLHNRTDTGDRTCTNRPRPSRYPASSSPFTSSVTDYEHKNI